MKLILVLLLFVSGCSYPPQSPEDRAKQMDDYAARRRQQVDNDRAYCTSLGGTVVLSKSFDLFYVNHCIIGTAPVIIGR